MELSNKVTANHLKRNAYLYVRQSTIRQVFENKESTKRQYDLRGRAAALGWADDQVHVIDCDLGESGASTTREGFRILITEVSLGRAGVVMGLEVSRLARNSSDWHRLLEICALTSTLILDEEGIYNPAHFNDRLLLGLKGTMSEAELHVIRARLFGGMLNKARRGELKMRLPVGFIYDFNNKIVKDPDKRVQAAIQLFFETFRRIGTAGGTVSEFSRQNLSFPKKIFHGPKKGDIVFSPLTPTRANQVLHNPRYAGIYAFGVRQQFSRGIDEQPAVKFVEQDQWKSFIKDAFDGYISWENHQENLTRLAENAPDKKRESRIAPREGPALLQGLAICGRCGLKMTVRYHARRGSSASPDYLCTPSRNNMVRHTIPGHSIDILIAKIILERISHSTIEVAMAVHNELLARLAETDRIRLQHVENAKYEMEVAKRRYLAIDPNNRLVADELESDWNLKIKAYRDISDEYNRRSEEDLLKISDEKRQRILGLAESVPKLWHSSTTKDQDRKRMVRLLIKDVTLTKNEADINVQIRFVGGAIEEHQIPRPRSACEEMGHPPEVVAEIDRLLNHHTDGEVAEILNQKGHESGTGKTFDSRRVQQVRRAYMLSSRHSRLRCEGRLTIHELCEKFSLNRWKVYDLRNSGKIKAYRYDDAGRYLYELQEEHNFHTMSKGCAV